MGKLLDIVRTVYRVRYFAKIGLFLKYRGDVPGDPSREFFLMAHGLVIGVDLYGIRVAEQSRHGLGRCPKHVGMSVEN